jgi:hypothetical protein
MSKKILDYVEEREELVTMQFKLKASLVSRLKAEAASLDVTMSELMRAICNKFIEDQRKK